MDLAPAVCWSAERISTDFSISRKLIAALDAEKGISSNKLLSEATEEKEEKQKPAAGVKDEEKKEGQAKEEANGTGVDTKMEEAAEVALEEKPKDGKGQSLGMPVAYIQHALKCKNLKAHVFGLWWTRNV